MDLKEQIEQAKDELQQAKLRFAAGQCPYEEMEAAAKRLAPLMTRYQNERAVGTGLKPRPISHHALLRNTLR